ncbi:D-alanine--D-alanine ligase family protein [Brevibacterium litoralis]|uniref:D-alanine--D-alanine ligase family protein n=1 Tax=Brevibacterium litoralis TaxID=3138935 RepID=UPI0032EDE25C
MTSPSSRPLVAVLFGGRSSEHSVSCVTASGVLSALEGTEFEVLPIGITPAGVWRVVDEWRDYRFDPQDMPVVADNGTQVLPPVAADRAPLREITAEVTVRELGVVDVYFPLLHGPFGEDGTLQGLFDLSSTPYVGSGVFASAASMDKHFMKMVLRGSGIPTSAWETVTGREWSDDPAAVTERVSGLGFPVFVKPARAGSSMGVSKVSAASDLGPAVQDALEHDDKFIVEPMVTGREIECGVLGSLHGEARTSVAGEIVMTGDKEFYDFEAKYLDLDGVDLRCPADLPADVQERVQDVALRTFRAFDCTGLARVDTFVTVDGQVLVNEINTLPGFTPSSMYPVMWQQTGVDYTELVTTLLDIALHEN